MKPALFLDRDGIINHDSGYTYKVEDFIFKDGIFSLCKTANELDLPIIVVTNQAGIGRGYYTEEDFLRLTSWMLAEFDKQQVVLLDVEFCPYHPVHGVGEYRRHSQRRKPNPGMILDASKKHKIHLSKSVMIGDKASDMLAAYAAGIPYRLLMNDDAGELGCCPEGTLPLPQNDMEGAATYLKKWMHNDMRPYSALGSGLIS